MYRLSRHIGGVRIQAASLAALFVAAFYVPFGSMVSTWWKNTDYSYGFLIPVASAYLFWERRKTLAAIQVKSAWWVLPVLVLFILVSLYGILGSSGNVSMPSIPVLIILFTGFCFGLDSVRRLILPLGFLFLMVPVPDVIERTAGMYLKTLSSRMGGAIIGFFNIPVNVSGNVIDLGVTQLQVVDACSGLRYIFPLFALGIVFAHFFERAAWKRALLVILTIPIGVFLNAFRIGVTGILTDMYGPGVSEGFFHGFSGFVVFAFALGLLFVISRALRAVFPEAKDGRRTAARHETAFGAERKGTAGAFLLSVALLLGVAFVSLSTGAMPAVLIDGGIKGFPLLMGQWKGSPETVDPAIVAESGAEEAFSGNFVNGSGDGVSLYMGYRSTAFLANENFFHSPTVCIPSSGWVERSVRRRTVPGVARFGGLDVTEMIIEKAGTKKLVYFWFQTKDEATHDKNINRFHLSLHAIRRDNTHDLFVRPIAEIYPAEGIEKAEERMDGFVREMMPVLLRFLEEKQVRGGAL